jgi:predicted nucleotidyltransferase
MVKLKIEKKAEEKSESKEDKKKKLIPTLNLKTEHEIAMDFATKVYKVLGEPIKSIVLFGSTVKGDAVARLDIDIIVIIDDVSINWDIELAAWYREELAKIVEANPYAKELHINTVRLSTWWDDLLRGDPVIINVLRYGESLIDFAGFFQPQKYLLLNGKIKGTPEAIYSCLQRAPAHLARSKSAELSSIEGVYWCMVDSAHAALISSKVLPPSPEHIGADLTETFVNKGTECRRNISKIFS